MLNFLMGLLRSAKMRARRRTTAVPPVAVERCEDRTLLSSVVPFGPDITPLAIGLRDNAGTTEVLVAQVTDLYGDSSSAIQTFAAEDLAAISAPQDVGSLGGSTQVRAFSRDGTYFTGNSESPDSHPLGDGEAFLGSVDDLTLTGLGYAVHPVIPMNTSIGFAVANDGTVAGESDGSPGAVALPGGEMEHLPGAVGPMANFPAWDISADASVIVGSSANPAVTPVQQGAACTWTPDGIGGWNINFLADPYEVSSDVRDVTASGSFASGWTTTDTGVYLPTLWDLSDGSALYLVDQAGDLLNDGAAVEVEEVEVDGQMVQIVLATDAEDGWMFYDSSVGYAVPLADVFAAQGIVLPSAVGDIYDAVLDPETGMMYIAYTAFDYEGYVASFQAVELTVDQPTVIELDGGFQRINITDPQYDGDVVLNLTDEHFTLVSIDGQPRETLSLTINGGPGVNYVMVKGGTWNNVFTFNGSGSTDYAIFYANMGINSDITLNMDEGWDYVRFTPRAIEGNLTVNLGPEGNSALFLCDIADNANVQITGGGYFHFRGGAMDGTVNITAAQNVNNSLYMRGTGSVDVTYVGGSLRDYVSYNVAGDGPGATNLQVETGAGRDFVNLSRSRDLTCNIDTGDDNDLILAYSVGPGVSMVLDGGDGRDIIYANVDEDSEATIYGGDGADVIIKRGRGAATIFANDDSGEDDGERDLIICGLLDEVFCNPEDILWRSRWR